MRSTALLLGVALTFLPSADLFAQETNQPLVNPVIWPQSSFEEADQSPGLWSRFGSALGGAVVGAGLGFLVSQVVRGDWEDQGDHRRVDRSLWATVGGSVGFAVAFTFPLSREQGRSLGGLPSGRYHIGAGELLAHGVTNAYQAVTLLRPEWTLIRGEQSLARGLDPVIISGRGEIVSGTPLPSEASTIQVYVDDLNIGGIENLRSVEVSLIRDIYFFDTAKATARWGGRNPHGAILIIT
jgi:hypothetical protein